MNVRDLQVFILSLSKQLRAVLVKNQGRPRATTPYIFIGLRIV